MRALVHDREMHGGAAIAAAIIGSVLAATGPAHAGCPSALPDASPRLAAQDDDARFAYIHAHLGETARRATIWLRGWEIGIAGATALDLLMIPILGNTRSNQIDFGLGAATTIIGIVPLAVAPPRVIDDRDALDEAAGHTVVTVDEKCARLADAERRLALVASSEALQRSWYFHAGNLVLNAGVTLLFGAFHHWTSGILNGVGGFLVGEVIIYTQPSETIGELARYRRGELEPAIAPRPPTTSWQLMPIAAPNTYGLGVAVTF